MTTKFFNICMLLVLPVLINSLPATEINEYELADTFRKKIGVEKLFVSVDGQDNVIVTGFFSDSISIGQHDFISEGIVDLFIAKYDKEYNLQWVKHAGGANIDFSKFINTDRYDNIYLQGMYKGKAYFGGYFLDSKGTYDYFTAKYNNQGELLWVKTRKGDSIIFSPYAENHRNKRK